MEKHQAAVKLIISVCVHLCQFALWNLRWTTAERSSHCWFQYLTLPRYLTDSADIPHLAAGLISIWFETNSRVEKCLQYYSLCYWSSFLFFGSMVIAIILCISAIGLRSASKFSSCFSVHLGTVGFSLTNHALPPVLLVPMPLGG